MSVLGLVFLVTGCTAHYYKVTDPQSGKEYYTQKIDNLKGGAVKLKDAVSGIDMTLQNSEVKEIDIHQYKQSVFYQINKPIPTETPAAPPAAAPAPSSEPIVAK